jgi:hypothetical protein
MVHLALALFSHTVPRCFSSLSLSLSSLCVQTGTLLGVSDEGSSKKASGAAGSGYSKAIIKTGKVARGFREIIVIPVGMVAKRTFV